jgi:hypothetical protein
MKDTIPEVFIIESPRFEDEEQWNYEGQKYKWGQALQLYKDTTTPL